MSALVTDLLALSLKGAGVAAVVGLVLVAGGRHLPAALRHALWLLVFVRLLVPAMPESPLALLSLGGSQAGRLLPGLGAEWRGAAAGGEAVGGSDVAAGADVLAAALALAWALGFLSVAGRALVAELRLRRRLARARPPADPRPAALADEARRRLGVHQAVPVLETSCVASPAVHGLLRPRVLLPTGFAAAASDGALRHVLLHEMAHVRRRDLPLRALAFLAAALHWFNPAAWLALRRLDAECDLACDAAVLARLGGDQSIAYGRTLLDAAARPIRGAGGESFVALPLTSHRTLERRIRMIARFRPVSRRRLAALSLVVAAVALAALPDAPAAAGPADLDDVQKQSLRETFRAMREVGTALFSWRAELPGARPQEVAEGEAATRFDWSRCAPLSHAELAEVLGAEAAAALPRTDGWGHPLDLCLDRSGRAGRLALGVRSPGRDGDFEGDVYTAGPFSPAELDRDVVWMDGYFVAWPEPPAAR